MEKKSLITWTEEYELGYNTIDEQHKKLVEIINNLYNAFVEAHAMDVISEILNEMLDYTAYHFKTEEDFFVKNNYPEMENHNKEHRLFVEKTKGFINKYSTQDANLTYDVMNFLRGWLLAHIQGSDREYSRYFKKMGIKEI
ncbi:MAG: hemerythrin family protein [Chlorobi bacterium]|nr:hemerythrin family protein [Chlorobiota bacterium]